MARPRGHAAIACLLLGLARGQTPTPCTDVDVDHCTAKCSSTLYDLSQASASTTSSYLTASASAATYYFQSSGGGLPSSLPACNGQSIPAGASAVKATFNREGDEGDGPCTVVGVLAGQTWGTIVQLGGEDQVVVNFPNGENGFSAVASFNCDKTQSLSTMSLQSDSNNQVQLTINTKFACPGVLPPPPKHSSTGAQSQAGWIVIGVAFGGFAAYLGVGFALNHRNGVVGADRVPHRDFWASLPGLVGAGFSFTRAKVMGRPRAGGSYDAL